MSKIKKFISEKKYLLINIAIMLFVVVMLNVMFPHVYITFYYALITFCLGVFIYFKGAFLFDRSYSSALFFDYIQSENFIEITLPFPSSATDFGNLIKGVFLQYFNIGNLSSSLSNMLFSLNFIYIIFLIFAMFFVAKLLLLSDLSFVEKKPEKQGFTRTVTAYRSFQKKTLYKIRDFIRNIKDAAVHYKLWRWWLIIFLFYFNVISLCLVVLGYFFVVIVTFNVVALFECLYSCLYMIYDYFIKIHWILWLIAFFIFWNFITKKRAANKLYKYDTLNEEFCENIKVSVFLNGVSGAGKSTVATLISIYKEQIFRKILRRKLDKFMSYFPNFNFQLFNKFLDDLIKKETKMNRFIIHDKIYSTFKNHYLKIVEKQEALKDFKYEISKSDLLNSYDYFNDKVVHFNGLIKIKLFDLLATYAECYYLFTRDSLAIVSNAPLATTLNMYSKEYFKSFQNDWNKIEKNKDYDYKYSGVINFDSMRLGNRFDKEKEPPIIDALVINIDEIDKERGNMFSWRGLKQTAKDSNLLNDKFGWFTNTIRHGTLVDNEPLACIIMTCQRQNDLTAGLIESCESLIDIQHNRKKKNTYKKFCFIRYHLAEKINAVLEKIIYRYLQSRNYYSMFYYMLINLNSYLRTRLEYINNRFGYDIVELNVRDSRGVRQTEKKNFYIIYKRAYANNFKSDSLVSIYENKAYKDLSTFTLDMKYLSLKQTERELEYQNSSFYKIIKNNFQIEQNKNNYYKNKKKQTNKDYLPLFESKAENPQE